jgi:hypothetical protein
LGTGGEDQIGLESDNLAGQVGVTLDPALTRASLHPEIVSLDIAEPAQLREEGPIEWMGSGLVHFGNRVRRMDDGDAVHRPGLLRLRDKRPNS